MNGKNNDAADERRRRDPDDEGWVYPDRMPGGIHGGGGTSYGYDVRRTGRVPHEVTRTPPNGARQPGRYAPAQGTHSAPGAAYPPQSGAPQRRTASDPHRGSQMQYRGGRVPPQYRGGQASPQYRGGPMPQRGPAGQRRPAQSSREGYRAGIRQPEQNQKRFSLNKKTIALIAAALILLILLIIIIPKLKSSSSAAPAPADTTQVSTEQVTETEPEPEPEPVPAYSYAVRDGNTIALGDEISCKYAILIDVDENRVVAEKEGDTRIFPASMTKVMTALTAIEKCADLNDTFTMTSEIVAPLFEANATSAGFAPGEVITVKDLIYGAILPSGADGTGGLAEYTAGSEAAFAEMMNEKAASLGLNGSHFTNASGLHSDDHYSTCHDIAIIMEAAMDVPELAAALGSAEYVTTTQQPRSCRKEVYVSSSSAMTTI